MLHHTMSLYKNKKKEKNVRYIQKNPTAPSEEQTVDYQGKFHAISSLQTSHHILQVP